MLVNTKQTIVFDFDGVIHSYKSGWRGTTVIPDEPVPGIKEAILQLREVGYNVAVVSTRCATYEGLTAVKQWLFDHDILVDEVCKEKPPAIVYIDDRAICFDGHPETLLEKISNFKPWNKVNREPVVSEFISGLRKDLPMLTKEGFKRHKPAYWQEVNYYNNMMMLCPKELMLTSLCGDFIHKYTTTDAELYDLVTEFLNKYDTGNFITYHENDDSHETKPL